MGLIVLGSRVKKLETAKEELVAANAELVSQVSSLQEVINGYAPLLTRLSGMIPSEKVIQLDSSTEASTDRFAITVDDDGELTVTPVTTPPTPPPEE